MILSTNLLDSRNIQLKKLWIQALIFREFWKSSSDTCIFEFSYNTEKRNISWSGGMKIELWELLSN